MAAQFSDLQWTPFTNRDGTPSYQARGADGAYYYTGNDGKVYHLNHPGEVNGAHDGFVAGNVDPATLGKPAGTSPAAAPSAPGTPSLQPFYNQAPPQAAPTMFAGANANTQTGLDQGLLNSLTPDATISKILQGFAPQAQRSTNALNDTLATAGIVGGAGVNAQEQLQGQLGASLSPALAQAIQQAQSNQIGTGEFGVSNAMQQGQFNAGLTQQAGLANQSAANQSNEFNIQNLLQTQMGNTSTANSFQELLAQLQQGAYSQQFNAFQNLNGAGLGANQGVNQQQANNFQVPGGTGAAIAGFGQQLGSALAPAPHGTAAA